MKKKISILMLCALTISLSFMSASAGTVKKNGESNYTTLLNASGDVSSTIITMSYTLDANVGAIMITKSYNPAKPAEKAVKSKTTGANIRDRYGNKNSSAGINRLNILSILNKNDLRIANSKCYLCRCANLNDNSYLNLPGNNEKLNKRTARSRIRNQDNASVART